VSGGLVLLLHLQPSGVLLFLAACCMRAGVGVPAGQGLRCCGQRSAVEVEFQSHRQVESGAMST
jgi:hypothetical protein